MGVILYHLYRIGKHDRFMGNVPVCSGMDFLGGNSLPTALSVDSFAFDAGADSFDAGSYQQSAFIGFGGIGSGLGRAFFAQALEEQRL